MHIRPAHLNDAPSIWRIIGPTIRTGETYALDRDMSEADALAYWLGGDRETFIAEEDGEVAGTYYIRDNHASGGRHICNCGYMTDASAMGHGVARAMCQHSLEYRSSAAIAVCSSTSLIISGPLRHRIWSSIGQMNNPYIGSHVFKSKTGFQNRTSGFINTTANI